jgi:hypothetical protein
MMNQKTVTLELEISAQDVTNDELDGMTRNLLAELHESDVESAELVRSASAPAGTKSAEVVTAGAIAISVLPTVLPKIIEMIQAWVMRGHGRTVKFKGKVGGRMIEFEGSADDLQKILATLQQGSQK